MNFTWTLEPGQPLFAGVSRLTEGVHYNYSVCGHTLLLSLAHPTSRDIRAIKQGEAAFALLVRENIVFLLVKIGARPWAASQYNWWINPPFLRPDPQTGLQSCEAGITLPTCLADANTGLVAAARNLYLSPDLGRTLLETVARQARLGLDPWRQLEVAQELLERSPDLSPLLKEAVCLHFFPTQEPDACLGPTPFQSSASMQ